MDDYIIVKKFFNDNDLESLENFFINLKMVSKEKLFLYIILNNHLDLFKCLLPIMKIKKNNNYLIKASEFGNLEMVKLLLPLSNPNYKQNEAIITACYNYNIDIVKYLLPFSNKFAQEGEALVIAAMNGDLNLINLLNPADYPKKVNNSAVLKSIIWSNNHVLNLFLPFSNINEIKKRLESMKKTSVSLSERAIMGLEIINDYELNLKLNKKLKKEVDNSISKIKRKI